MEVIVEIRDSREGVFVDALQFAGIRIVLDVAQRLSSAEIVRISMAENVRFITREGE